jgi:hypothetical protein
VEIRQEFVVRRSFLLLNGYLFDGYLLEMKTPSTHQFAPMDRISPGKHPQGP